MLKREKGTKTTQQNKGQKQVQFVFLAYPWALLEEEEGRREGIYTRTIAIYRATLRDYTFPHNNASLALRAR
jgi:hypothetical protein